VFLDAAPGDFYLPSSLELNSSPAAVAEWRAQHGLNLPWTTRYAKWLTSASRGEFGRSLAYEMPVLSLLRPRVAKTLEIVIPALLLCWCGAGVLAMAAVRRRAIHWLETFAVLASLLPDVIGISLLMWLAVGLHAQSIATAWLPIVSLTLVLLPTVILHATNAVSSAAKLPFVKLAERRGIATSRLWRSYVLPAAANPLISLAGLSLAGAIGTSLFVEVLLGWPGLGPLFLEAAQSRDYPVVTTVVVLLGAVLTASNLLADLALYRLDPRIRLGQ
jgi:peptide/nickel transport system permease protein